MSELGLTVPTRNILTGAVVNWAKEEMVNDGPENLTLSWKDLTVFRMRKHQTSIWKSAKYEEVKVLHGVSGVASAGNLVAIMGSSGAGKTTLLAAISRREKSSMSGYLMLNGRVAGGDLVAKISGFVPQHDLAVEDMNVSEHMEFTARLMMDRRSSAGVRTRRIHQLLSELGVSKCVNTKLGALSGGERKRVSLAVQLLNDPPLLFCDEPTTGLDSWAASAVTSRLRSLASAGKVVVCSIHQPASGVFELFHQVVFLAGGRVAFHGNIDQAADFFSSLNYKCPIGFNQAEYYVSQLGVEIGKEMESRERIRRICDEYQRSGLAADMERRVNLYADQRHDTVDSIFDSHTSGKDADPFQQYLTLTKVNNWVQFYWLMWRNITALRRNSTIWIVELVLYLFVGLLVAVPYMNVTAELDQRDIQNVQGLMYLTITETIFLFIYAVFHTFPQEVPILLRETANGLYSPGPYYLSKMIFWIPRAVVAPTLFASLVFFLVGLRGGADGWLSFCFICVLCANYANAYGSCLSSTFDSMETAALFSVPFDLVGTMFSGVFLNLASLSPFFAWIKYVSPFYYGVESISILQWDTITDIKCVQIPGMPCITTGEEVLKRYGFADENYWDNVFGLTSMYFIAHFIAYLMVVRRSRGAPVY